MDVYGQSEICTGITTQASCSAGYELVNARIEWASADRTWTAAVGVQNLANKEYYLNKFDLSGFGQPTTEGQPGAPREWYFGDFFSAISSCPGGADRQRGLEARPGWEQPAGPGRYLH